MMDKVESIKRCLDCGYSLQGLPENRCPECGRSFDPNDPETFAGRPTSGVPALLAALGALLGLALALSGTALGIRHLRLHYAGVVIIAAIVVVIGCVILGSWAVGVGLKAIERPRACVCHRWCYVLATVLGLLFRSMLYMPELWFVLLGLAVVTLLQYVF